jgi:mitotic spindle assembly checkpoint protein MAD2B
VVVIKDKDEVALERFIFSIQNMIEVESYNKDTRFILVMYLPSAVLKLSVLVVCRKPCLLPFSDNISGLSS